MFHPLYSSLLSQAYGGAFFDGSSTSCVSSSPGTPSTAAMKQQTYRILDEKEMESAWILYIQDDARHERVVLKWLKPYQDMRYNLKRLSRRRECQLEAFKWNVIFSPGTCLGLASILSYTPQETITLGGVIRDPKPKELLPRTEYVLLMREQPEEKRLDNLLQEKDEGRLRLYFSLLAKRVASLHKALIQHPTADRSKGPWGTYKQLITKLQHNLELFEQEPICKEAFHDYHLLGAKLLRELERGPYERYFKQRRDKGYIRRCHGDLKSPNIWIVSTARADPLLEDCVVLLDAIDFRAEFYDIDILSDFALLAVDIQVRTGFIQLANQLISEYLLLTDQENELARRVLGYYMVEKALVCGAISIIYDHEEKLGLAFLETAKIYIETLK